MTRHPPVGATNLTFGIFYKSPLLLRSLSPGNPDVLICGNCRECFSEITELLDHKRTYCKLRFACKCQQTKVGGCVGTPVAATPQTTTTQAAAAAAAEASSLSTSKKGIAGGPDTDIDLCGNLIVFAEIPSPPTSPSSSVGLVGAAPTAAAAAATARLLCVVCKSLFLSPWDLMVHVQAAHMINIYELGTSGSSSSSSSTQLIQAVSPPLAASSSPEKEPTISAGDSVKLTLNGSETKPSADKNNSVNHNGSAMDAQSPGNEGVRWKVNK